MLCSTLPPTFPSQINFLKDTPVHPSAIFSSAPNIPLSKVTNGFLVFDTRGNFIYLFILSLLVIKKRNKKVVTIIIQRLSNIKKLAQGLLGI